LLQGARIRIEAVYPEVDYKIRENDIIHPRMEVFSSYDLGWKYGGRFGAFQVICSNGLTIGKIMSSFKKRHVLSLDYSSLKRHMEVGMSAFSEQTGIWKRWAEKMIPPETYEVIWADLPFSAKEKEKVEEMSQIGTNLLLPHLVQNNELNLWQLYSFLSQYSTHNIRSEVRRVEIEPEIIRALEKHNGL
jgi:hypothetical protein